MFVIDDSAAVGTVVANITVADSDEGSNGTIILESDPDTPFDVQITGHEYPYTYAELFVANSSHLVPGLYTVILTASDRGVVALQSSTEVVITVEYALPDVISFRQDTYYFEI